MFLISQHEEEDIMGFFSQVNLFVACATGECLDHYMISSIILLFLYIYISSVTMYRHKRKCNPEKWESCFWKEGE